MTPERYTELKNRYSDRRSHSLMATGVILRTLAASGVGIALSMRPEFGLWLTGQLLFGASLIQWFVLMHDLGHNRFFQKTFTNDVFGHLAGAMIVVPFYPWRYIHGHHHIWTGWRDQDPTMSVVHVESLPRSKRTFVDFCWRWWIPVFSLAFSFSNFWNFKKLFSIWDRKAVRARFLFSIFFLLVLYSALIGWLGVAKFIHVWGLGYLFFLVLSDPLLISQHSHIPQNLSDGQKVRPVHPMNQDVFTRTLLFPKWVSKWLLLGFDNHVVHHFFPAMPCYQLWEVREPTVNQIAWWKWLRAAKALEGHRLLFQNSKQTGVTL